jgi:hypothetical protein
VTVLSIPWPYIQSPEPQRRWRMPINPSGLVFRHLRFLGILLSAILSAQHPISTLGHHRSQPPLPVTTRIQCASTNDGWTPLSTLSATSTTSRQTVACSSQPAAHHYKATTPIPSRASTPIDGCPTLSHLRHAKPLSACTELSQSTPLGPRKWGR